MVIATDDNVRNAAKAAALTVKPAMKAERITTSPAIEPSTNPAPTSLIGARARNFSKLINTWAADKDIISICLMTMPFSLLINAKRFEE